MTEQCKHQHTKPEALRERTDYDGLIFTGRNICIKCGAYVSLKNKRGKIK